MSDEAARKLLENQVLEDIFYAAEVYVWIVDALDIVEFTTKQIYDTAGLHRHLAGRFIFKCLRRLELTDVEDYSPLSMNMWINKWTLARMGLSR